MAGAPNTKWTIIFQNDVGPNDEGYWEWWELQYEGIRVAKLDSAVNAKQLAELLNELWITPAEQ